MVKIFNGEIVQDNDPRLTQSQQSSSTTSNFTPLPSTHLRRSVPSSQSVNPGGSALFGLRDVHVGGYTFTPQQYLVAGGLTLAFGWQGALAAVALYLISRHVPQLGGTPAPAAGSSLAPSTGGTTTSVLMKLLFEFMSNCFEA